MNAPVESKLLDIPIGLGACDCFVAHPAADGPHPIVILLTDAYGLRENIFALARSLASEGYFVFVPNLFYRMKRAPLSAVPFPLTAKSRLDAWIDIQPLYLLFKYDDFFSDLKYFFSFFSSHRHANPKQVALVGYCMGGALALRVAAKYKSDFKVVASFHAGDLVTKLPDSPHLLLSSINAEIYVAHADKDTMMTNEQIKVFSQSLNSHRGKHKVELYENALHGFAMADMPNHHPASATRHWQELLPLLKRTLA